MTTTTSNAQCMSNSTVKRVLLRDISGTQCGASLVELIQVSRYSEQLHRTLCGNLTESLGTQS